MERHINTVAFLHIAYGVILVLVALFVYFILAGSGAVSGDAGVFAITAGIGGIVSTILLVLALPAFLAGWGLLKRYEWSRVLVIILSIIDLFSFPIGTAVGVYSLWVMAQAETRAILNQ